MTLTKVDETKGEREPSKQELRISHKDIDESISHHCHIEGRSNHMATTVSGKQQ
jgi:hypothetical protein